MKDVFQSILLRQLHPGDLLGIIGVGTRGTDIQQEAKRLGISCLLCDPPRALDESEELNDSFFQLWGNGMGGCQVECTSHDTFLPLKAIARANIITMQVPLTNSGSFPTCSMITKAFLDSCRHDARLFCQSPREVIAPEARSDSRIVYL